MRDDRDPLDGAGPPLPPAELRARVLAAVGPVLAHEPVGRWTRIWQSRPLRISWAAAMALLALAHVALSLRAPRREGPPVVASVPRDNERAARPRHEPELARAISLPRIDPDDEAWTALFEEAGTDEIGHRRHSVRPPSGKEKS